MGNTIEVWDAGGEKFVELDGSPGNYGIKQPIANPKAGGYVLTWRQSGRNSTRADSDPYRVKVFYMNGTSEEPIAQPDEFSGFSKMQWTDNALGFQITSAQLAAAGTNPIYVAFIPTGSLNTYGTLIDKVSLLPVDLDILHPASGELDEAKEDGGDGGYVSVQRLEDPAVATSDATPKTKLLIRAVPGAQSSWKMRLKFAPHDRYKIYSDAARTHEVATESTEFPANSDKILWFRGMKKSLTRGGEMVTMQINANGTWVDGDAIKCTVVQSEFLFQVKAFIPYAWTETESEDFSTPPGNLLKGKVAKGDLHSITSGNLRPTTPGFINLYSTDAETGPAYALFRNAPFRVCQTVIITPYDELHTTADIMGKRKQYTAPLSEHYVKSTSVDSSELALHMGFKDLNRAGFSKDGKPPGNSETYEHISRSGKISELTVDGGGKDGAMPDYMGVPTTWATDDIHWRLYLKVWCDADPLNPKVEFGGKHDSYPAYEIIVIQSDGSFKDIHRVSPAAGLRPGPGSLDPDRALSVGRTDIITK